MKNDAEGFILRLNDERPRSRIILASSYIEELIRQGVLARLEENTAAERLFGEDGSVGANQSRQIAEALGLISGEESAAIAKLAQIRNRFAHSWKTDFLDHKVQKLCAALGIISILNARETSDHQLAFLRADYIGVTLVEVLGNRFLWAKASNEQSSKRIKHVRVDLESYARTVEWKTP